MRNPYEVLGIPPTATPEKIKSMYRKLAMKYHADVNTADSDLREWSHRMMTELNAAYAILSNPAQRAAFDQGATSPPQPNPEPSTNPPPSSPPPTASEPEEGLFNSQHTYYVGSKAIAQRYIERALEELMPVAERLDDEGKALFKLALALGKRGALRWLPLGTYNGPELREKVETLAEYAEIRLGGRGVALLVTYLAAVAYVVLAIWQNAPEADGWAMRIIGSLFAGSLGAGAFVWLPLAVMRGGLRLAFDIELGAGKKSWFWQGTYGLAATALLWLGAMDEAAGKSNGTAPTGHANASAKTAKSEAPATRAAAAHWIMQDAKGVHSATRVDLSNSRYLIFAFLEDNLSDPDLRAGELNFAVCFGTKIRRASERQPASSLLNDYIWTLSHDAKTLVYQGNAIDLLKKLKPNETIEITADTIDGNVLKASFNLGDINELMPVVDKYIVSAKQKERAFTLAQKAAERIMQNMGGGQELDVKVGQWSYDKFQGKYTITVRMEFHGAIVYDNVYNAEGQLTVNEDGSGATFSKERGNIWTSL